MASGSPVWEELNERYADLRIEDEEDGGLIYDKNEEHLDEIDIRWYLVGKLLTERPADFDAMKNVMASLWRPGKGMYVKELDVNLYLFQFFHEVDIQRVIGGSPWTFNKTPLIIERLKEGENPRTKELNKMEIWVQIHDLKPGFMSDRVVRDIGSYIGTYVSSCQTNYTGTWRDYLRVRVILNIDKPLKRRMKICRSKEDWFWVNFKYERLPTFCFICGILGHSEKYCERLFDEPLETIAKPYGLFMKALDRRPVKQIGAKWLKDGRTQAGASNGYGGTAPANGRTGESQSDPKNVDTVMEIAENQGEISGDGVEGVKNTTITKFSGNISCNRKVTGFLEGENKENIPQNEELIFMDPKRRRTQDELGQNQNNEAEMGLNGSIEASPKNDYVAGSKSWARQGL